MDEATESSFIVFELTPLAISLFCGVTFEELEIFACLTLELTKSVLLSANEFKLKNTLSTPTQLTTN